jgi:hypothetical protein
MRPCQTQYRSRNHVEGQKDVLAILGELAVDRDSYRLQEIRCFLSAT